MNKQFYNGSYNRNLGISIQAQSNYDQSMSTEVKEVESYMVFVGSPIFYLSLSPTFGTDFIIEIALVFV